MYLRPLNGLVTLAGVNSASVEASAWNIVVAVKRLITHGQSIGGAKGKSKSV